MALSKQQLSVEDYLDADQASPFRSEFINGDILMMTGSSPDHSVIASSVIGELYIQLTSRPCRVYQSDMRVRVNAATFTYPDTTVVCGESQIEAVRGYSLLNPTLIVEVLSPSTEKYDRTEKFDAYRTLSSLQEYILVAQDAPRIEQFQRQPDGSWVFTVAVGLEAVLELPSIGCTLALAKVYDKIVFAPAAPSDDARSGETDG